MILRRQRDRTPVAWRNGAGVTEEVAAARTGRIGDGDADRIAWRVSIATVDKAAPFSRFDGIDRLLMPLTPAGIHLRLSGAARHVSQFDVVAFPGEADVASIEDAPGARDLNLMVDRAFGGGRLVRSYVTGARTLHRRAGQEVVVVVALCPTLRYRGEELEEGDAIVVDDDRTVILSGYGSVAEATIVRATG